MKTFFLTFSFLVLLVSCKEETKNETTKEREIQNYTINQFMDNESVSGGSFSSDNSKLLVSSNRSGIYNVYTIPVTGGELKPITQSDSTSYFANSYFPNDDRMLFSADNNGDEIDHIYVRDLDGDIKDITPDDGAKAEFYGWAEDDKHFYYGSNKRDPRFFDVYKMSIDDYSSKLLYKNEDGMDLSGISNDENYFALSKTINTNDSDLFIHNAKTGETLKINENLSGNSAQDFSKDSSKLYYTTDDSSEFEYLMSYDLETKESKKVLEKSWDILGVSFTSGGSYMTVFVNEDGKNAIFRMNPPRMVIWMHSITHTISRHELCKVFSSILRNVHIRKNRIHTVLILRVYVDFRIVKGTISNIVFIIYFFPFKTTIFTFIKRILFSFNKSINNVWFSRCDSHTNTA